MRRYLVLGLVLAACNSDSGGNGAISDLRFAIVGDTRPPSLDDTGAYPTSIITTIYQDIEAESPSVPFVVSTGDYMFANPFGSQTMPQLALYMGARGKYSGTLYPAMGNHECDGATAGNCASLPTPNTTAFISTMLGPINQSKPYYTQTFTASDNSWTAKLVVVACNAWDSTQASWLMTQLAMPTTYTFVVRHEGTNAIGSTPCAASESIISSNPLTLLIAGHSHTYEHLLPNKEIIVGIGGAPLTSGSSYGYVLVARNADGSLSITGKDYQGGPNFDSFSVQPSGASM